MWPYTIFGLGMLIFVVFAYHAKLYGFKGTKLRTRLIYGLGMSSFLTFIFLLQSNGDMQIIATGLGIGVIFSLPLYVISKKQIEKRVEVSTVYYKRRPNIQNILLAVIFISILFILFDKYQNFYTISTVLGLGACFAAFLAHVVLINHVVQMEDRLDSPIMEDEI